MDRIYFRSCVTLELEIARGRACETLGVSDPKRQNKFRCPYCREVDTRRHVNRKGLKYVYCYPCDKIIAERF